MMGMGEPLYNFEAVKEALLIASDGDGLSLSKRRITLSTSGVVPNIYRAGEEIGVMLAISLHAVNDKLRDELVPINKKYPLKELMQACRDYPGLSNARRITFEYVMLKGVNDSLADARELEYLGIRDWLARPEIWLLAEWPEKGGMLAGALDLQLKLQIEADDSRSLVPEPLTRSGRDALELWLGADLNNQA